MMLKSSSIFFSAMCILPIFIDGTPIDVSKQAPATDVADLPSFDHISLINLADDISADTQQESEHEYTSRHVDEETEDYTELPTIGLSWENPTMTKQKKSYMDKSYEYKPADFSGQFDEVVKSEPKENRRRRRDKNLHSLFDSKLGIGTLSNPLGVDKALFGNKIFLFNKDPESRSFPNKKGSGGKKSFFLFDNGLPDPFEKLDFKN